MHSDWPKLIIWSETSNPKAIFHNRVITLLWNVNGSCIIFNPSIYRHHSVLRWGLSSPSPWICWGCFWPCTPSGRRRRRRRRCRPEKQSKFCSTFSVTRWLDYLFKICPIKMMFSSKAFNNCQSSFKSMPNTT